MKQCSECGLRKAESDFYSEKRSKSGIRAICKQCSKTDSSQRNFLKSIYHKIQAVIYKGGQCQMCGYGANVAALDFHHRNPETKESDLANILTRGGFEKSQSELDKCDLLCANCHRILESGHENKSTA